MQEAEAAFLGTSENWFRREEMPAEGRFYQEWRARGGGDPGQRAKRKAEDKDKSVYSDIVAI